MCSEMQRNSAQTLNKIARQEAFQDASYKTPLENMLKVCDNAAKVLRQLNSPWNPMIHL